jgi:hypothetical protein
MYVQLNIVHPAPFTFELAFEKRVEAGSNPSLRLLERGTRLNPRK